MCTRPLAGRYDLCAGHDGALQAAHFKSVCAPGDLQQRRARQRARPVVDRLDAEPDEGALRGDHHAGALAGPPAGDGAEHPASYTFAQARPRCRRSG